MRRVPARFFARDAVAVAPELLNKILVVNGRAARISEVEAYTQDDPASHSHRGQTKRNEVMFGPPGRLYVYFIYGVHHCANIVTGPVGDGQAVLLRGVVVEGVERRRTNGPGKLCDVLGIDMSMNGIAAQVFDDGTPPPDDPLNTVRVGITKAVDLPWRWIISA